MKTKTMKAFIQNGADKPSPIEIEFDSSGIVGVNFIRFFTADTSVTLDAKAASQDPVAEVAKLPKTFGSSDGELVLLLKGDNTMRISHTGEDIKFTDNGEELYSYDVKGELGGETSAEGFGAVIGAIHQLCDDYFSHFLTGLHDVGYQPKAEAMPDDMASFEVFGSLANARSAYPEIEVENWEQYSFSGDEHDIEQPTFLD